MSDIFTKNDYESGDGMLTSIWGPSLWHYLHTMSFNYPNKPTEEAKNNYYNFIVSLKHVLPCKYCRENYSKNLKSAGFKESVFNNRTTFSKFIYNLHQEVNKMLGKESNLEYNDVRIRYEHFRSRCLVDKELEKNKHKKIENGCVQSLYGQKSKCVLRIVPKKSRMSSFKMSPKCNIKKLN